METAACDVINEMSFAIRGMAQTLHPDCANQIDVRAKDRHDYEIQLATKAWEVSTGYRERLPAESKNREREYVAASLWRQVRSYHRSRRARVALGHLFVPEDEVPSSETYQAAESMADLEAQMEARDMVRVLRSQLTDEEWDLALRLGDSWSPSTNKVSILDVMKDGEVRRTLHRRIAKLREKAHTIFPDLVARPD